jgi:hypothetical protein
VVLSVVVLSVVVLFVWLLLSSSVAGPLLFTKCQIFLRMLTIEASLILRLASGLKDN